MPPKITLKMRFKDIYMKYPAAVVSIFIASIGSWIFVLVFKF